MADNGDDDGFIGFVVFVGIIIAVGYFLKHKDDKKINSYPPPVVIDQPQPPPTDDAVAIAQANAEAERARTEALRLEMEQQDIRKAQEEADNKERIKFEAVNLAQRAADLIVSNKYGGGSNVGANLVNYEYYEGNYILTVELRWNANYAFNHYDLAADGTITASKNDSNDWNFKWSPSWQSSELNDYLETKGVMRIMGM